MSCLPANLSAMAGVLGGSPTLPPDNGQWATPNGYGDPLAEAVSQLEAAMAGQPDPKVIVAIGLGLGFIIDAIELKYPAARIVALEPTPGGLRSLLDRRDLTTLLSDRRLLLLWGPEYVGAAEAWKFLGDCVDNPPIVRPPALHQHDPAAFTAALRLLAQMVFGARANAEARRKFAGRYLLNTLGNLPLIARSADVGTLFGAFNDVPGIIVSAGPSLDDNLRDLASVADRALLIAVDTALRPLLAAGIHPHLVIAVDPSDDNARHLQALPDTPPTHLVAEGSLDPMAFPEFAERVFTFNVSDHHPWPWLRSVGVSRASLRAWGSVATSAFDLALKVGCNPIAFVGQDLAYTKGQPYCRGTTFERSWAAFAVDGRSLADIWDQRYVVSAARQTPDVHGKPTFTTAPLVAFRDWLVEQCGQRTDRRFINATGAGILCGSNIEQGTLMDAMSTATLGIDPFAVVEAARRRSGSAWQSVEAAIEILVRDLDAARPSAVVEAWQEFSARTVTSAEIRTALTWRPLAPPARNGGHRVLDISHGALLALPRLSGLGPRRDLPSTAQLPERVAAIRAVACGDDIPHWAAIALTPSPTDDGDARVLIETATVVLCRLLALPALASGVLPGYETLDTSAADSLPLTAPFDWLPAARADVDRLERLVRSRAALISSRPETDATNTFRWSVPPGGQSPFPFAGPTSLPISSETLTWWARRALVIEWASLLQTLATHTAGELAELADHMAAWVRDLASDASVGALDQATTVLEAELKADTGETQPFRFELRTPPWRLMRAMTGAITLATAPTMSSGDREYAAPAVDINLSADDRRQTRLRCAIVAEPARLSQRSDPRLAFLRRREAWLAPMVLPLPHAYIAARLDDATAMVTPYLATSSVAIDADGRISDLPPWPYPIVGERRGNGTGGVAWSHIGSWYLMRRSSETAAVDLTVAPFLPGRAVVLADGTSLWSAITGGLWAWYPDGSLDCVASTPPTTGIAAFADGIRLDPIGRDRLDPRAPRAEDCGWLWRPGANELQAIDLGPFGPICSWADGPGAWAAAHPAVDIIRLGDHSGARCDLACDWPSDVAWAGDSLVAVTAHGTALVFKHLARMLADRQMLA